MSCSVLYSLQLFLKPCKEDTWEGGEREFRKVQGKEYPGRDQKRFREKVTPHIPLILLKSLIMCLDGEI